MGVLCCSATKSGVAIVVHIDKPPSCNGRPRKGNCKASILRKWLIAALLEPWVPLMISTRLIFAMSRIWRRLFSPLASQYHCQSLRGRRRRHPASEEGEPQQSLPPMPKELRLRQRHRVHTALTGLLEQYQRATASPHSQRIW